MSSGFMKRASVTVTLSTGSRASSSFAALRDSERRVLKERIATRSLRVEPRLDLCGSVLCPPMRWMMRPLLIGTAVPGEGKEERDKEKGAW